MLKKKYRKLYRYSFWILLKRMEGYEETLFVDKGTSYVRTSEYPVRVRKEEIGYVREFPALLQVWLDEEDDLKAAGLFVDYFKEKFAKKQVELEEARAGYELARQCLPHS